MKTEEKLKEFEKLLEIEAERIRKSNLREINAKVKEESGKEIREAELKSKEKINEAFNKLNQERNKKILETKNSYKKELIDLRQEYKNNIFENVEKKLWEFTKTEEYKLYLVEGIKQISNDDIEIYLSKQDMLHADFIKKETHTDVLSSNEDLIGGFKAIIRNKNMMIDNSFRSKLLEEREKFNAFKIV